MRTRNLSSYNKRRGNGILILLLLVTCHSSLSPLAMAQSAPDVTLIDQTGKRVQFCGEMTANKVVIINFIYTTCEAVCSMQGAAFSKLQAELGERMGREVVLISISADPDADTPARLKEWGARFGAKPGWLMLTGERAEIDKLFRFFTGDIARKQMHSPVVFIGSCKRSQWAREYSLSEPARFLKFIEESRAQ